MRSCTIVAIVLTLLKLTDAVSMLWFEKVTVLSAAGTPLWMLLFGLIVYGISQLLFIISNAILES